MKIISFIWCCCLTLLAFGQLPKLDEKKFREGDVILQSIGQTTFGKLIQVATHSRYDHVGIVFRHGGKLCVFEGTSPKAKFTPIAEFVAHNPKGEYLLRRAVDGEKKLTSEIIGKMKTEAERLENMPYDMAFGWSDDAVYCSEVVWKVYQRGAAVELCATKKFKDFDLRDPRVKKKLNEIHGKTIPYEETVVAPSDLETTARLQTID